MKLIHSHIHLLFYPPPYQKLPSAYADWLWVPQGLPALQPRHWQLAEEKQGDVRDGWGSTANSPRRPVASLLSFIEDLRTMAHS